LAINYGRKHFKRVAIFRPHNVYGPDMGWEHVIPQFCVQLARLGAGSTGRIRLPIQGTGQETRSFIYVDDLIDGVLKIMDKGTHLQVYHIGTEHEITIAELAEEIGHVLGREVDVVSGELTEGSTPRRCPNITKMRGLGFEPRVSLRDGLRNTVPWYVSRAYKRSEKVDFIRRKA
jgi:UDP-glucose 4-epimerase